MDAEPEERFCHSRRIQGRSNEIENRAVCAGCLVAIPLIILISVIAAFC